MKRPLKQFVVGDTSQGADFSEDYINSVILRLALWFNQSECDRKFDNPEAAAKKIVKEALLGQTKDGKTWHNAPNDFATRIKIKAAYDLVNEKGIPISRAKHPTAVRKLQEEKAAERAAAKEGAAKIKDMVPTLVEFDVQAARDKEEKAILEHHPELDNPVHYPHVRRLSLLYAQQEMIEREMLLQPKPSRRMEIMKEMQLLTGTIDGLLKTLDIHPDSLRKRIKENSEGSLGDFIAMLDADDEFRERQKRWTLEELLQLWYKCNHPNGEGTGPQMSEVEMWHETRTIPFSFTCLHCGTHYPHIVQGLTPKQIRDYLVEKGVLIEVPVVPQLTSPEELEGIHEFIDSIPEMILPSET